MQFKSRERGDFQRLAQLRAHVCQMCQHRIGIGVGLIAEDDIAVDRELIVTTPRFRCGLRDEGPQDRLGGVELGRDEF